MFKGVKRVLCGGIDKRCSYAFLLILCGFLLSTKMTTPEMMNVMGNQSAYRQGARQAAAALCPLRRACLTGIGLRIFGNAVSAQRISVNLGVAPCSQCSQGSAAR